MLPTLSVPIFDRRRHSACTSSVSPTAKSMFQRTADLRLPKEAQRLFIPFVNERDSTGKLLPKEVVVEPQVSYRPTVVLSPKAPKPNSVFFRTADTTTKKLKRARYVSPPVGCYDLPPRPQTIQKSTRSLVSTIHTPTHQAGRSTDFLNFDEMYQRNAKHVSVVDMARVTAREREHVMTEEEKWLFLPKFELPEHLRKFKGFYDVSGFDMHKIEDPDTLFASAVSVKKTIKSKITDINKLKKDLDAKLFR